MSEILFETIAYLIHGLMRLASFFLNPKILLNIFLIVVAIFFAFVAYYYLAT